MDANTRRAQYAEYLRSPHWQVTRRAALARADHRCQVCNSQAQLDVHHRTYARVGAERDNDIIALCHRCHTLFHEQGHRLTLERSQAKPRPKAPRQESALTAQKRQKREARADRILLSLRFGPCTTAELVELTGLATGPVGTTCAWLRDRKKVARIGNGPWHLVKEEDEQPIP